MDKQATVETPAKKRVRRSPVNGRNILSVSDRKPGYHYRFVNDVGDRVASMQEVGYELVDASETKVGERRLAGTGPLGSKAQASVGRDGTKAFLMRIPNEYFFEDQQAKVDRIKELESTMTQQARSDGLTGDVKVS